MGNPEKKRYAEFEAFMQRHRKTVWRTCCRFAHNNRELCRDMVQEVFLTLWLHYDQLNVEANQWQQRAWVWRTTRSVLVNLYRMRKSETVSLENISEEQMADTTVDFSEHIDDLMLRLSNEDRRLMQMRLDGYDAAEIAQALGIERNTVYQRVNRIINKLRKAYGK